MLETLIDDIRQFYHQQRHWGLLTALWQEERWFDTPRQRRAAEIARDVLEEAGLQDVGIAPFAADGVTCFQDWMTHLAWDCPSASLAFADGGEVLADRTICPQSVVYWSGPLARGVLPGLPGRRRGKPGKLPPPEPVAGEVVDADALKTFTPQDVDGKFLLTGRLAADLKRELVAANPALRPLAIVSDFLGKGNGYTDDTTKWCNRWSDGPDNWYFHASDAVMTGFCLSPAAGRRLRQALAAKPHLTLAGHCASRLYEGSGQCVTGVLEGKDPAREIWLYAHACEQGAHDNCAGVSVILEALRLLKQLVQAGRLAPPRYGIRAITTEECIGMAAFATLHDDLRRRALAGLNVDGAGGPSSAEVPFNLTYGPLSAPSFGWAVAALAGKILHQRAAGKYRLQARFGVPTADDMIADPNCGVPSLWLGQGGNCWGYHSSADTPDICNDDSLSNNVLLTAAWAYTMASLDERVAAALLPGAVEWIDSAIIRPAGPDPKAQDAAHLRRWTAAGILRDLGRWGVPSSLYESHAARYAPADAPPLPDLPAEGPRYARRTWGTCTFEALPIPQRRFSRWSDGCASALYWTDGLRPLAAIQRLVAAETGRTADIGPLFESCLQAALAVQLK
jgi:hypothetical protein